MAPRLFILACFALMGWAYWSLSGGASFEPQSRGDAVAAAGPAAEPSPQPSAPVATRADSSLDALADVAPPTGAEPALPPAEALSPDDALAAVAPDLAEPVEEAVAAALAAPDAPAGADATTDGTAAAPAGRLVTGSRVNMREGPGTGFAVVGQVANGDRAEVLEVADGWARIRAPGGQEGWMSERFLAPPAD